MILTATDLDKLYEYYLLFCKDLCIEADSLEHFKLFLSRRMADAIDKDALQNHMPSDLYYVASRAGDDSQLVESVKMPCMQCRQDCWIDKTRVKLAKASAGVLCIFCYPEVSSQELPTL